MYLCNKKLVRCYASFDKDKTMAKEVWKPVVGYEKRYVVSSEGRIKRLARNSTDSMGRRFSYPEKILSVGISRSTGYPSVSLRKNGKSRPFCVHRLIAEAFIPNPQNLPCVNHIDENRANSVLSNLEWASYGYNNTYGEACKKRKETLRKTLEGKHKRIWQFNLDGELVNVHDCGIEQLEEHLGYSIGDCLLQRSKTSHGFVFSYSPSFSYVEDKPKSHQKYVILLNGNGEEERRFKSVSEAGTCCGFDRHYFSRTKPVNGIITIRGMRFKVEKKDNEYIPKEHWKSR